MKLGAMGQGTEWEVILQGKNEETLRKTTGFPEEIIHGKEKTNKPLLETHKNDEQSSKADLHHLNGSWMCRDNKDCSQIRISRPCPSW